jgi:hypothetical protein
MSEREPVTYWRNVARLKALWPHGMFPEDWLDLFKEDFERANQAFLADAMKQVKRRFSSHQPELKWFHEAYRERLRVDSDRDPGVRKDPALEREEERRLADIDHAMMLRDVQAASESDLLRARDHLSRGPLRCILERAIGDPAGWPRFSVGMFWAALQKIRDRRGDSMPS